MLTGFEIITEDLNPFEEKEVLPLIVAGLRSKKGKSQAVTSSYICKALEGRFGKYKLNPVKLRKIISTIRINGILQGLCSNSKGYYLAETDEELQECIDSLSERLRQQQIVVDALEVQYKFKTEYERVHG
jgi:hypothetical protein